MITDWERRMNLLTIENLTKNYTERMLFDNVNFSVNEGEKIGIIGINGTGKSTLLKIIAGMEEPDEGTFVKGRNLKIAYLSQNPVFNANSTLLDSILEGNVASDEQEAYTIRSDAKSMLNRLGITNYEQKVGELSGGQRKRLALVKVLLSKSDLLVLDEPTNHLDSEMADWLEQYLRNFRGALVMVTHDRYFLDSVTNRIVEIDKGQLYSYEANYLGYLQLKQEREEILAATERKRQSLLRVEIAWMMRGARARSTKQKAHIARYEELRDQDSPIIGDSSVELSSVSSRMGKTTIEIDNLSKAYGDRILIKDFSYVCLKQDRLGIIGPNGCGKSTLMKMIMGLVQPDSGKITIGQTIQIGYFSQENECMDDSMRMIDYVREGAEMVRTQKGVITASQMLERFLFPRTVHYTRIEKLSGGEKRRLYLLRILMEAPNVLILDEPTNDLDIQTLTILEDYLDSFDGIVIVVSHDRYFLDRVVRRIFAFEENGRLMQYEGGYTDYQKKVEQRKKNNSKNGQCTSETVGASKPKYVNTHSSKLKFTYKEQKEYDTIEDDISALEEKMETIEKLILQEARNYSRLQELTQEKEELTVCLEEKMERWMYLEELAKKISEQS
jgi:ATP-binding cassette subfamily F protein uup